MNLYYFGTALVGAAIMASFASAVLYFLVTRGRVRLLPWARGGVYITLGLAAGSALLLLALFVWQRYDIRYVYDYSSSDLEFRFRVAALWAGQPGSLVVWALAGLLAAPTLIRRTRNFEPYALSLLMALQAILLIFMLIRNPFAPTLDADGLAFVPTDGRGLNPQLHNLWMVIHPPTLFLGYGLLGVMFVLAMAGLWRRDYDGWVKLAMPWALAGWAVLGMALTMGGYWAYESLGWGGYWGWDPVENSSLVPWLISTALIHGLVLQKAHGGLRRTNFFLAILAYLMVFYASFLTRSGVLANFSVHSFVEEGLKGTMLLSMILLLIVGIGLLAARWRDIPRKPLSESLLARDTSFILLIMAFLIIGTLIALGTSVPWISSVEGLGHRLQRFFGVAFTLDDGTALDPSASPFTDGRFSFTADFFKRTAPPLAVVIVLLMAVAPLFGWRDSNRQKLLASLRWPTFAALAATGLAVFLGVRSSLSLIYIALATLAISTNMLIIARTLRSGWLRIGGYLAHVGMGLLLIGVVGSYAYSSEDVQMVIPQGATQSALGHTFSYWGEETLPNGKTALRIEVDRDTDPFVARPELFFNERMGAWTQTPAIRRLFWKDLYISPANSLPADDPNSAQMTIGSVDKIGPYLVQFIEFNTDNHQMTENQAKIGASLVVTDTRSTAVRTLLPQMQLEAGKAPVLLPVDLGEGHSLVFANFNLAAREIVVQVDGLNLPIIPAKAILEVSTKPAIALVWTGSLLMFCGAVLAWLRRRAELAALVPSSMRRPARGLGGWLRGRAT